MDNEIFVSVSLERYQQLIRAEHDANMLKALIVERMENYQTLSRGDLEILQLMFIGKKEEQ